MKLNIFAILLISLSACEENCTITPTNSSTQSNTNPNTNTNPNANNSTKEQFVLDNQAKLTKFLGDSDSLNTAFTTLKNSSDKNEKKQALAQIKKAIDDYVTPDYSDLPALHRAAFTGNKEILEILLESGADIDLKNSEGKTALHQASSASDKHAKDIVEFLLKKGADASIKDNQGKTALDVAFKPEVKALLQAKTKPVVIKNNNPKPVAVENSGANANDNSVTENNGDNTNDKPVTVENNGDNANDNSVTENNGDNTNDKTVTVHKSLPINEDLIKNSQFSPEEIKEHERIVQDPNTQEFINLFKATSQDILKEVNFSNLNKITVEEFNSLKQDKKKLEANKPYLNELLAYMIERVITDKNDKNLFAQLNNSDLFKIVYLYDKRYSKDKETRKKHEKYKKIKDNLNTYINSLTKKDSNEFNNIANIAKQSTDDALVIIDTLIEASDKSALTKVLENIDENLIAINENNFSRLFWLDSLDKNLIYKNIKTNSTDLIKNIIKNQQNIKPLTSILSKYSNLKLIDADVLNAFKQVPFKEDLLEIIYKNIKDNNIEIEYDKVDPVIAYTLLNLKQQSTNGKKDRIIIGNDDTNKAKLLKILNEETRAKMLATYLYDHIMNIEYLAKKRDLLDQTKKAERQKEFLDGNNFIMTKTEFDTLIKQYNNPKTSDVCKDLKAKNFTSDSETLKLKYDQILGWLGCAN